MVAILPAGVQIQLKGQKITVDMSDEVVRELIAQIHPTDLRDLVFNVSDDKLLLSHHSPASFILG